MKDINYTKKNFKSTVFINFYLCFSILIILILIDEFLLVRRIIFIVIILVTFIVGILKIMSKSQFGLNSNDHYYMDLAFEQAEQALKSNNMPIGAVLVVENNVISAAFSTTKTSNDERDHAECIVIKESLRNLKIKDFTELHKEVTVYSTSEPCPMCRGFMIYRGVNRVVYSEIHCRPKKNMFYKLRSFFLLINTRAGLKSEKHYQIIKAFKKQV